LAGLIFWRKKKEDKAQVSEPVVVEPVEIETVVEAEVVVETESIEPTQEVVETVVAPVVMEPEVVETVVVKEPVLEAVELPKRRFAGGIKSLFSRIKFDLENLNELEDILIQADFGVDAAEQIVAKVKAKAKSTGAKTEAELKQILTDLLAEAFTRDDIALKLDSGVQPYVILVVGVNGAGKTTTIGKLANWLVQGGAKVTLGAADTFRAAAVEQLATWAQRSNSEIVKPTTEGQEPASVAYETVEKAIASGADIAIVDTAGRLQNKQGLMDELGKIRRVIEKQTPISEVLLVLDATTGQNALTQAKAFAEVAQVTGIVLTKLDGTAKGGIVYAIQEQLNLPIKLVGVGEGIDDFAFFDPQEFATGLVG
jgi:fused signal recognition particle receptor